MRKNRYRYLKIAGYETAYDVTTRWGGPVAEVDRNGPNDWVAETHDGHRGVGRTRDAAVDAALAAKREASAGGAR